MEINGVAHVVFRARHFTDCVSFYDRLMPELGLQCVHRDEGFVYYVGGRTALAIRPVLAECADQRHVEGGSGLDHLCWRVRSRDDVDAVYALLTGMGAEIVRPPQEGPWAPGYYSLSFLDPEGLGPGVPTGGTVGPGGLKSPPRESRASRSRVSCQAPCSRRTRWLSPERRRPGGRARG